MIFALISGMMGSSVPAMINVTPRDGCIDYVIVGEHLEAQCGPPPAGATSDEYWGPANADGVRHRHVRWWGRDYNEAEVSVYIDGTQHSDGRVERGITLLLGDNDAVTATISLQAAAVLIEGLQEAVARWDEVAR